MIKQKLFRLNRSLHRDIGYLCLGLTIVFAVSGLALNHRTDWNPNYSFSREQLNMEATDLSDDDILLLIQEKFGLKEKMKGKFWVNTNELKIFYPNETTVVYKKNENTLVIEQLKARFLLRGFNGLHVNELKKAWVIVSDIYAILLLYLAISALFMVKGKYGIRGRGGVLVFIGLLVPIYFMLKIK